MVNYRTFNAKAYGAGESGSIDRAWGVMRGTATCSGSVTLEGFATQDTSLTGSRSTIKLEHLIQGEPFPCYVREISVTSGVAYVLA